MDGRGGHWGGNNPAYPGKALQMKMVPKGMPYMMQMVAPQGMYPKGANAPNMMMPPGGNTAQMPPSRMSPYQDPAGHMQKMLGKAGPGYMSSPMQMAQGGMMPQERMANLSAHMQYRGSAGNSPVGMGYQRAPIRQPQLGPGAMAHGASPISMGHGLIQPGTHLGMSPRGIAPNMSPSSMGHSHQAPLAMPSNVPPKHPLHYPPHPKHQQGPTMGSSTHGSQIMGTSKMGHMAMQLGGMNVAPGPGNSMAYIQVGPSGASRMVMQGPRPGAVMTKPKMPVDKGPASHMKAPPPVAGVGHNVAAQPNEIAPTTNQPSETPLQSPTRAADDGAGRPSTPTNAESAPRRKPPAAKVESAERKASQATEEVEKCVLAIMGEQLKQGEGLYGKTFVMNEAVITATLIEGFLPILEVLWQEIKGWHKYGVDEPYLEYNNPDITEQRGLVMNRDMRSLEEFYRTMLDIEKVLTIYRTRNKSANKDPANANATDEEPVTAGMLAQEYAEVGYNQRHLVQRITAVDYRNALEGDFCKRLMPDSFRLQQIKMASTLHFDIHTPPQCVSPPAESVDSSAAEIALSNCASSMDTSLFPSIAMRRLEMLKHNHTDMGGDMPMMSMDMRYAKTSGIAPPADVMMQMSAGKQGFSGVPMQFPKGMNFPMMQMSNMSMGPGGPQGMPSQFGPMGMNGPPGKQGGPPSNVSPRKRSSATASIIFAKHGAESPLNTPAQQSAVSAPVIPGQQGGITSPSVPSLHGNMGMQMSLNQLGPKSFQGLHAKESAMLMQGPPSQLGPMGLPGGHGKQGPKRMHGPPGKRAHVGKTFHSLLPIPPGKHGHMMPPMSGVKLGPPKPPMNMGVQGQSQQVGAPMRPPSLHPMMLKQPPPVYGNKYN
ncbi:collagen alpha-1(XXVII) chain, putative [Babesia ovata]|uniref:Collagen alpha-1(XXVII) chain, putative n=1 Tax=Babesia ovata TaxID=189622 RepID=A0A2H6KGJ0_9APIC|nr:collagen alpha-1(XXVII) chain, putative [Babesia ovata]GBE62097.1 collagen alpha-1(XXVII) chain, putative [Babesia ovata]